MWCVLYAWAGLVQSQAGVVLRRLVTSYSQPEAAALLQDIHTCSEAPHC